MPVLLTCLNTRQQLCGREYNHAITPPLPGHRQTSSCLGASVPHMDDSVRHLFWLRANKLSLNYNKTNFMRLTSRKHNPASFKVIVNNHNISPEDNLKYLGVLLDNKLSWKPHVQKVKTQLSRACGVLSKLKHYTTPPVLKVVYNSLIRPYLKNFMPSKIPCRQRLPLLRIVKGVRFECNPSTFV